MARGDRRRDPTADNGVPVRHEPVRPRRPPRLPAGRRATEEHDGGDISAVDQDPDRSTPPPLRAEITALWDEYEAAETPEARLAKALDKLETILQHTQGDNPPGFDYAFNLEYGRRHTTGDPLIEAMREILDEETKRRAEETAPDPTDP